MKRTPRKPPITHPLALSLLSAGLAANAAVHLRWTVETSRVQPAAFEAYQGETLELDATLQSYGKPISNDLQGARIYWQTNGMGSAYWSASASAEGNVLRATWTPAMDVGARAYNCFIGSPSNSYRAAFQLRLRPSPGASPNNLQLPTPVIDFAQVEVANAPWLEEESDPTVPAWAKAATKPTYTAGEVGALPLVEDYNGLKTAVTIGSRTIGESVGTYSLANGGNVTASGISSHAEGDSTTASGYASNAEGIGTTASGDYSHAEGSGTTAVGQGSHAEGGNTIASGVGSHTDGINSQTRSGDQFAFAWNGDDERASPYTSHGPGTFNINPAGGLGGFYIGERTLASILTNKADKADVSATNPTFSNAVLAVGLNIDTNSVAVLNDIAETFGGFPLGAGETATTVGGLLAALAAAVAWLKKNKVGSFASVGGATATVDNGVAKLEDFFKDSNSLLNGRLAYSRNATGLKDRAFNTLSFDGTEYNLSAALEAVTPTASGQPCDLLIVATATAATTISFTAGTIKGDKPTIDGAGTWLITLTEYASGVWYCRQIKMEDAA